MATTKRRTNKHGKKPGNKVKVIIISAVAIVLAVTVVLIVINFYKQTEKR